MREEHPPNEVEINTSPDLIRLVDQVQKTKRQTILRRDGEIVAIVMSPPARRPRSVTSATADFEAFSRSAGSWRGIIDINAFWDENGAQRLRSIRPAVRV